MESVKVFNTCKDPLVIKKVSDCIESGALASGHYVSLVESELAKLHNKSFAYAYSNMTVAIENLLKFLGIGEGDLIACHPYSCLSTTMAIAQVGAKPIWIDLEIDSPRISVKDLSSKIESVKAVLLYNIGGFPSDLVTIEELCARNSVVLINDCNNATLSKIDEKMLGEYGDYSIHSFYPNRDLSSIDGGLILTNVESEELSLRKRYGIDVSLYRNEYGEISEDYSVDLVAGSNNFSNVSACMVYYQLDRIGDIQETKSTLLAEVLDLLPKKNVFNGLVSLGTKIVPWAVPIKTDNPIETKQQLLKWGVESTRLHLPNQNYEIFPTSNQLRNTEKFYQQCLWIPADRRVLERIKFEEL